MAEMTVYEPSFVPAGSGIGVSRLSLLDHRPRMSTEYGQSESYPKTDPKTSLLPDYLRVADNSGFGTDGKNEPRETR